MNFNDLPFDKKKYLENKIILEYIPQSDDAAPSNIKPNRVNATPFQLT